MSNFNQKAVGINPQSQIHYTDHLAVICILMGIPLLFIDEFDYSLAKKYYPQLQTIKLDYSKFTPEFLIENYDVLFMSDLWDRNEMRKKYRTLEEKYQKVLRVVHCPHGFSDKGFYLKKCANEDITLIYGQNMLDQLKLEGVYEQLNQYVITGNYRFTYFKQHRSFFDQVVQTEVLCKFASKQPILLYAPTWLDLEESSTFFDAFREILENLPSEFNMIVKLHPRLELDNTALYYQILGKYDQRPNLLFLKDFPLVFPLLAHSDIYLGDMSSVGYDFLAFNKPMFFLNKYERDPNTDRTSYLFRCGIEIRPNEYKNIYKIIEKRLALDSADFSEIRKKVYHYTFGDERSFANIKQEIIRIVS